MNIPSGLQRLSASRNAVEVLSVLVDKATPAYLSDTDAADVLALLCEEIGELLEHGLVARRYAMSGDRRGPVRNRPVTDAALGTHSVPQVNGVQ